MNMNKFLNKNISKILTIFLILQPILDVLTAIAIKKFNYGLTIGAITRFAFLIFCIFYMLFLNKDNRKLNWLLIGVFITYLIIFSCLTLSNKNISILIYELKNTFNSFYLPLILLAFYEMFKQYDIKFDFKYILIVYSIYLFLIIVPDITHTSFLSYSHSKLGTVGWFMSANAVGNILSILLPLVFYYLIKVFKNIFVSITILGCSMWIFVNLGTKAPLMALFIIILFNVIYFYIHNFKFKNYKLLLGSSIFLIACIIGIMIIIPKTSFYKNLEIHRKYLKIDSYSEILTNYDNVNNFIFSERLTFLNNSFNSYKKASVLEKIFGIGYVENYGTEKESTKTIEIDYCDIFIRHGIFGSIMYFSIFIYFLIKVIKKIFEKRSLLNLEILTSVILILLLGIFSGHILITPAVSIYISLLFILVINCIKFDNKKHLC